VNGPAGLGGQVLAAFRHVHQTAFAGDPAVNPALAVAVTDVLMAGDTPTVVLLTPWTLNGLAFPPDRQLPARCEVGGVSRLLFRNHLAGLGEYYSVNLIPDVSGITTQGEALKLALSLAEPWRDLVATSRGPVTVTSPARRRLLDPRQWGL
jgi:[NiFe]-hydrogenase assembly, chaperone, HybE